MNFCSENETRQQIRLGIFGYGEVGHGLALGLRKAGLASVAAYQRNSQATLTQDRARISKVRLVSTPADLAHASDLIVAVTQGTESIAAARSIRDALGPQHCYVDLASATPGMKQEIAEILAPSGALYADGAIEGSPLSHEHAFPIIVSGPGARTFARALEPWGMRIEVIGPEIGRAAAIKGLRHILMKGHIALLLECATAARRLGVGDELFASVAEWFDAMPFMDNATRLLRTTTVHAERRADEARMSQEILEEVGIDPIMTRGTVTVLRKIAGLELRQRLGGVPPESLDASLELMKDYDR